MRDNHAVPPQVPREGIGNRTLLVLLAAAALAPLLHLLTATAANFYNAPYYDTWSLYYRVANFMNGGSPWGEYLFSQANESRPAVPRLLLFLIHRVSRNLTIVVILNLGLAIATAGTTFLLLKKTNAGIRWRSLLAAGVFLNLSFFSLAQWQNWNWHNQVVMFLPNLFFVIGWLINLSSIPPLRRGLLVSLCCALSSFSFANGLFQWLLLIPLAGGLGPKEKIRLWGLHFGAAAVCFVFYFTGYESPDGHSLGSGLSHPGRSITYVFVWLGSSLSGGSLLLGGLCGAILLLIFLFLGFHCLRSSRIDGLQASWLPWLSMGGYALISSGVAALGRSHIGLEQALRSRYCTISQWLVIGIVGLSVTLFRQNWQRNPAQARLSGGLLALLAASFIMFHARHEVRAADAWSKFAERLHFEKQSFGLEKEQPGQLWTFDHPNRKMVLLSYKVMQQAGFLRDTFNSRKVLDLIAAGAPAKPHDGEIEIAAWLPFRQIKCSGWSIGGDAEAGNRVLIVLIAPVSSRVLAVADGPIDQIRSDVLTSQKASSRNLAGFDLQFPIPKIEPGTYRLAAFRYGKDERSYYPVGTPAELAIANYSGFEP